MIKLITLDLGGVYFSNGTVLALPKIYPLVKVSLEEVNQFFRDKKDSPSFLFRRGKITPQDFWRMASQRLQANPEQLKETWYSSYVPNKGIENLVHRLKKKYYLMIFSGNIKERVEYLDRKYHFLRYFEDVVMSYDFGVSKDNIAFYQALVDKIKQKGYLPAECVLADDNPQFLEVAHSFGIKTILYQDTLQLESELKRWGVKTV